MIIFFIIACYASYNKSITSQMKEDFESLLGEMSEPNAVSFVLQMNEQIKKVYTMADFFGKTGKLGSETHKALLRSAVEQNGLLRCAIAFPDGNFITNDNQTGNVLNDVFFIRAMEGKFDISDPRPAVVDITKTVILFTSPIKTDGKIVGTLTYSYLCDDIDKIFNLNIFGGQGQMFVVKRNGQMLMGTSSFFEGRKNILEFLQNICSHEDHGAENCISITADKGAVSLSVKNRKEKIFINYSHLSFNDWYLFCIVPENVAAKTIRFVAQKQRDLSIVILLSILTYIAVALLVWIIHRENIDKLTGANTFENFKRVAARIIKSNKQQRYVIVKLDVKNFKLINRIYNFDEGDRLIKNMALSLNAVLPKSSTTFARLNTDTFIVLLPYTNRYFLNLARKNFISTFRELMGDTFTAMVEFPTGQYITTEKDSIKPDITEIFEKANFAHRVAKQQGSEFIIDYDEILEREAIFQKNIEDKMQDALAAQEFKLFLQPKFRVDNETLCGAEALVRWEVGGRFLFHPAEFVPVFEKNGFIVKIDLYMFELTVKKIRDILESGLTPCPISVNFSRFHLNNSRFVQELCEIVDKYGIPRQYLEIELTESVVFNNVKLIMSLLRKLHQEGFSLAMDDFGSGYSSLGLLKNLEIDVMKIDQTFFQNNTDERRAKIVVKNIMNMAKELHIKTVAEGVEKLEQVEMLREFGCDVIQGFYYAKPMDEKHFTETYFKT